MPIYVDADACPVKDEIVRVAARHDVAVHFVSNAWMRLPESPLVSRVVVPEGPDVADNWIAEHAVKGDIVVTQDIPLAGRCVKSGAIVLSPSGKVLRDANIGMAVAMRDLMKDLRDTGVVQTYNPGFTPRDRSQFLQALEQTVQDVKRGR